MEEVCVAFLQQILPAAIQLDASRRSHAARAASWVRPYPNNRASSAPGLAARMNASPTRKVMNLTRAHQMDIGWLEYATFRYDDAARGNFVKQLQGCIQTGFEGTAGCGY